MTRIAYAFAGGWLLAGALFLAAEYVPVTADSYAYVAAALSLVDSGRFMLPFAESTASSLPVAYAAWPPGFPALIGLFHLIGTDAWVAARLVSALSVLGAVLLIHRTLPQGQTRWLATTLVSCSCMTLVVAFTAWSEGPFILALVALWSGLVRRMESQSGSSTGLYLALGGLTLAAMFRYAGLFCVPIAMWCLARRAQGRPRTRAIALTILALLPVTAWLVRNELLGLGARGGTPAPPSWWRAFAELPFGLGSVALFPGADMPWPKLAAGAVLLVAAGLAVRRVRVAPESAAGSLAIWLGLSLLAGTLVSRFAGMAGPLTERLVWPGWILLLVGLTVTLAAVLGRRSAWALVVAYLVIQGAGVYRFPNTRPRAEVARDHFQVPSQPATQQAFVSNEAWRIWAATGSQDITFRAVPSTGTYSPLILWRSGPNVAEYTISCGFWTVRLNSWPLIGSDPWRLFRGDRIRRDYNLYVPTRYTILIASWEIGKRLNPTTPSTCLQAGKSHGQKRLFQHLDRRLSHHPGNHRSLP